MSDPTPNPRGESMERGKLEAAIDAVAGKADDEQWLSYEVHTHDVNVTGHPILEQFTTESLPPNEQSSPTQEEVK